MEKFYIEAPCCVFKFYNIPVIFDLGLFRSKRNEENVAFLFGISGYKCPNPVGKLKGTSIPEIVIEGYSICRNPFKKC